MRSVGENRTLRSNENKEFLMLYSFFWKSINGITILKVLTSPTFSQNARKEPWEYYFKEVKRTKSFKKRIWLFADITEEIPKVKRWQGKGLTQFVVPEPSIDHGMYYVVNEYLAD